MVTGGAGFLGGAVRRKLEAAGYFVVVPRRTGGNKPCDLRDREQVRAYFKAFRPRMVVHAAWTGGGIDFARRHPGQMAHDNVLMATHVIDACREFAVDKFVGIGSICSYPKHAQVPFLEERLWDGYPEETNGAYGVAKRMMLVLGQAYRQEYGLRAVHLMMVNLYGPGDNFDLEDGHVITGMVRRFSHAKAEGAETVTLWGDGTPTREFIYIDDAARAICRAVERYDDPAPVNIGSGEEISIRDLAVTIASIVGYAGEIRWDPSKPNGQPRRRLDVSRAVGALGFKSMVPLAAGLRETIDWYAQHRALLDAPAGAATT